MIRIRIRGLFWILTFRWEGEGLSDNYASQLGNRKYYCYWLNSTMHWQCHCGSLPLLSYVCCFARCTKHSHSFYTKNVNKARGQHTECDRLRALGSMVPFKFVGYIESVEVCRLFSSSDNSATRMHVGQNCLKWNVSGSFLQGFQWRHYYLEKGIEKQVW